MAGESRPAMASLDPSMTSAGLKAGGERGEVRRRAGVVGSSDETDARGKFCSC